MIGFQGLEQIGVCRVFRAEYYCTLVMLKLSHMRSKIDIRHFIPLSQWIGSGELPPRYAVRL